VPQALAPGAALARRAEGEERPFDPVQVQPRAPPTEEEEAWRCRRRRRSEQPCSGERVRVGKCSALFQNSEWGALFRTLFRMGRSVPDSVFLF
jgi:hypothetical protein